MFSATFPRSVEQLARQALKKPVEIIIGGRSVASGDVAQHVRVCFLWQERPFRELLLLLLCVAVAVCDKYSRSLLSKIVSCLEHVQRIWCTWHHASFSHRFVLLHYYVCVFLKYMNCCCRNGKIRPDRSTVCTVHVRLHCSGGNTCIHFSVMLHPFVHESQAEMWLHLMGLPDDVTTVTKMPLCRQISSPGWTVVFPISAVHVEPHHIHFLWRGPRCLFNSFGSQHPWDVLAGPHVPHWSKWRKYAMCAQRGQ